MVEERFRGMGILRAMSAELFARAGDAYDTAVAFIEASNSASLGAHGRLGWQPFAAFDLEDRHFHALSLAVTTTDPSGVRAGDDKMNGRADPRTPG